MFTQLREFMPSAAYVDPADEMFPPGPATDDLKKMFAEAFLRSRNDSYRAARTIEANSGKAQYIAAYWPSDPIVILHMQAFSVEEGAAAFLPTKAEFAEKVLAYADEYKHPDTKLDFLKLFAQVMGYVEKPSTVVNNNTANVVVNKVMVVPKIIDRAEARQARIEQQAKLINAAAV